MSFRPESQPPPKPPRLLEQMRGVLRVHRYALRTERAYLDWVRRYVKFHGMKRREDLAGGKQKVEAFLTHLAVAGNVAPSTQNQAFHALLFLYERVLEQPLEGVDALRAERKVRVPEVLTAEEARRVIGLLEGAPQLVVKLLYGSGLRLMEALRRFNRTPRLGSTPRLGCGWTRRASSRLASNIFSGFGAFRCARGFPRGRGKPHARRVRSPCPLRFSGSVLETACWSRGGLRGVFGDSLGFAFARRA